jgi:hypothetical protein
VKKSLVFLIPLVCLATVCTPGYGAASRDTAPTNLNSIIQTMKTAYAGSGNIVSVDSGTILIEPKMPAPVCAVPRQEGSATTWSFYAFPLASITVPLADIDEKLIGEDVVFTDPNAPKTYKPGDVGDTTLVIIAGVTGKQFHTLLYDRDKFLHLGPGPHTSSEYDQRPDDTAAFALAFSDHAAAQAFAAALKSAVLQARARASR